MVNRAHRTAMYAATQHVSANSIARRCIFLGIKKQQMERDFIHVGRERWFALPISLRIGALVILTTIILSLTARWRWNPEHAATKIIGNAASKLVYDGINKQNKYYIEAALRLVPSVQELARISGVTQREIAPFSSQS